MRHLKKKKKKKMNKKILNEKMKRHYYSAFLCFFFFAYFFFRRDVLYTGKGRDVGRGGFFVVVLFEELLECSCHLCKLQLSIFF